MHNDRLIASPIVSTQGSFPKADTEAYPILTEISNLRFDKLTWIVYGSIQEIVSTGSDERTYIFPFPLPLLNSDIDRFVLPFFSTCFSSPSHPPQAHPFFSPLPPNIDVVNEICVARIQLINGNYSHPFPRLTDNRYFSFYRHAFLPRVSLRNEVKPIVHGRSPRSVPELAGITC